MRHSSVVILDTHLRNQWYAQGMFGLSKGLTASARIGTIHGVGRRYIKGRAITRNRQQQMELM